jgi:predicted ester cyclase
VAYGILVGNLSPSAPDGVKQVARIYHTALPDLQVTVDDVFAAGEKVGMRWRSAGTHRGDLAGIPPTNKWMHTSGINIWRVVDGKVVEGWIEWDQFGMMQQRGVIPTPGQTVVCSARAPLASAPRRAACRADRRHSSDRTGARPRISVGLLRAGRQRALAHYSAPTALHRLHPGPRAGASVRAAPQQAVLGSARARHAGLRGAQAVAG